MKKNLLAFCLLSLLTIVHLSAQNSGCDGVRYKSDVFTGVTKTTVEYAPTTSHLGQTITLSMDVYTPQGDAIAERPVVILAHGGSFIFGDRTMMDRWCRVLAKKGYVAATITYRLYPFLVLGLPDSLDIFDTAVKAVGDMRAAVRYFREDAATTNQFGVDPDHIFIGGYSAGAVAALHCSYLDLDDDIPSFLQTIIANNGGLEGVSGTASNKTFDSASEAIVNMSGGLYRSGWIDATEVPMVSIHGTADETVPYNAGLAANIAYLEGSSRLHVRANDIGLWNDLHTVPGGGHTNIYDNAVYQPHIDTFWVNATTLLESLTCSTVSVKDVSTHYQPWQLAPNPNNGEQFTVQLPEDVPVVEVQLLSLTGNLMYQQRQVRNNTWVQLPSIASGIYLVRVLDQENPSRLFAVKKLIVD